MRCLILGGTGFIGRALVAELRAEGHQVTVFSRHAPTRPWPDVRYHLGDWHDDEALTQALIGQEIVYHLIWESVPATSVQSLLADAQANLGRSVQVFRQCVALGVSRVIFVSTGGAIYGQAQTYPTPEDHPLWPISAYGIHKAMVEHYLRLFYHRYGLRYIVARPGNAYGWGQDASGRLGAVARLVWCAQTGHPFSLYGDGEIVRDFVAVDDVARAFVRFLDYDAPTATFNIGTGIGTALNGLIAQVEADIGHSISLERHPPRWFDVQHSQLSISHIRQELGWAPQIDLQTGIRALLEG